MTSCQLAGTRHETNRLYVHNKTENEDALLCRLKELSIEYFLILMKR